MTASKRDELVRKALNVFYENGFHATGMDRLVAETGISKTSMYKHFRTKEDLILAVLRLRDDEFRNWLARRMEALATEPRGRLLAMFDALDEWFGQKGFRCCMFVKASAEYQDPAHPIHAQSAQHKKLLLMPLAELAGKLGISDPALLARQLLLLADGAIVTAHLLGREHVAADAKAAARTLIDNALNA